MPGRRPAVPATGRRPMISPGLGLTRAEGWLEPRPTVGGARSRTERFAAIASPWHQDVLADLRRLFVPAISGSSTLWVGARDEPVAGCDLADEFRARGDVQLLEDLAQVVVDGARAEEQPCGCVPVARA